jgi:hypothetical protein
MPTMVNPTLEGSSLAGDYTMYRRNSVSPAYRRRVLRHKRSVTTHGLA